MDTKNKYFASREANETAKIVLTKAEGWFLGLDGNGYLNVLRESATAYYGGFYNDLGNAHKITFTGEQGELTTLPVNHYRNLARHLLVMVTATRPAMQARATNTDYKSLVQTKLANGLLDYYVREKRLEDYFKRAIEMAIVMGSGYVKLEWNATTGDVYDYNEETNTPIYQGDVLFKTLSPFDVVFDPTKEDTTLQDWVLTRTSKNRFDLAEKYPELRDKILKVDTKDNRMYGSFYATMYRDKTDDVFVYEFYHKRTESMPQGRYLMFLDHDIVLLDAPMPYRNLPIYRVSASDILGTPFGYTDMFDVLPLQSAINSLYSTILTNQTTFGVQNVMVPRGCDVDSSVLAGGLNVIEFNQEFGKPEAINLTNTPPEIFNFLAQLEQTIETLSGVNSVARGNPESSLKSGNALALVSSMALQYASGLQQSYVKLIEDVGTGLINILKDFASVPRIAAIVGEANRSYMKEFTGDDLSEINRVIVDVTNPLSKCLAKDTPVLMYSGDIKMVQDIEIGEQIMGPDSKPRTVGNIARGQEEMYTVSSKDTKRKISYSCNESHILTLKYCSDYGPAKKGDILDIPIREYNKLDKSHKHVLQGFTVGVEMQEKTVDIPPYILGTWLGDGLSETCAITTMDTEIAQEWQNYANSQGLLLRVADNKGENKSKNYFITSGQQNGSNDRNPVKTVFKEMELIYNKHIPKIYLNNSSKVRLEILAGLLDTDGTLIGETFVITQKNDRLSENIVHLAKSLGFRVTYTKRESHSQNGTSGLYNSITIGGDTHRIPTRLVRKQAKQKEKSRDWLNYGIKVESIGFGDYYGFTLIEEPHFLLGDFTVTHNTTAGKAQMASELLQMGLIETPQQYITVLNTGNLDTMTDDVDRTMMLIRAENDKLVGGEEVTAIATEKHSIHMKQHMNVLADPDLKNDPDLVTRVLNHIQEHLELLRTTDPNLLMINGEQPLAPIGGSPANQPSPDQMVNTSQMDPNAPQNQQIPDQPANNMAAEQGINLPQPPTPPAPFENMPVTAEQVGLIPGE